MVVGFWSKISRCLRNSRSFDPNFAKPKFAGLVKWYNNSFPNCGREFDSPVPHQALSNH